MKDKKINYMFTKDTKILTCDNETIELNELESRLKIGEEVWVYSCSPVSGSYDPSKITAIKTGEATVLVYITLDSGEVIKCTPDHLFLKINGIYEEAQNLKSGDILSSSNCCFSESFADSFAIFQETSIKSVNVIKDLEKTETYGLEIESEFYNFTLAAGGGIFVKSEMSLKDLTDELVKSCEKTVEIAERNRNNPNLWLGDEYLECQQKELELARKLQDSIKN